MGIYDRDYNRAPYGEDRMGFHLGAQLSLTMKLIIAMVAVYIVQIVTRPDSFLETGDSGWFTNLFSLHAEWIRRPWMAFQLLTYGFLHDPSMLKHILFNMIGLWMFGRALENRYGPREYIVFFLSAVIFAGLFWTIGELVFQPQRLAHTISLGASGGIAALVILYAFNFPHQTVLFMFVLPMPMWVCGVIFVGLDAFGTIHPTDHIAYTAHLGGALFAALYYKSGLRLAAWLPGNLRLPKLGPRPRLRVHDPEPEVEEKEIDSSVVDNILRKITEKGQDSLSRQERQILEEASREEQRKRLGR